jgi:hypothetical protein
MRSDTAKKEMEKFSGTPTPTLPPQPTETPVDPADIVAVDINLDGDNITVNGYSQNKTAACTKYNPVIISGDKNTVVIKGACRQIMINGDGNEITADAAMEFVFNGTENTLRYARYPNGKRPIVHENQTGNTIEKVAVDALVQRKDKQKTIK